MSTRTFSALQGSQAKQSPRAVACHSSKQTLQPIPVDDSANTSRRSAIILPAFLLAAQQLAWAGLAQAEIEIPGLKARAPRRRGLDQYIQRKQLDPLETYVPVVLQVNLVADHC